MILTAIITGCVISYSFVGMTLGKIVHKNTKYSSFWDEDLAAVCMFLVWPVAVPGILLSRYSDRTVKYIDKYIETQAEKKRLPEAKVNQ